MSKINCVFNCDKGHPPLCIHFFFPEGGIIPEYPRASCGELTAISWLKGKVNVWRLFRGIAFGRSPGGVEWTFKGKVKKKLGVVKAGRKGKWSGEWFGRCRQTRAGEEMILRHKGTKMSKSQTDNHLTWTLGTDSARNYSIRLKQAMTGWKTRSFRLQ